MIPDAECVKGTKQNWTAASTKVVQTSVVLEISVVEPFHIGPAPAPASQDGGSGSSSSSSSSPVVHNLLLEKSF